MILKSQSGFSLISTVIALGVGLLIATATTTLMINQQKFIQDLESGLTAVSLGVEVSRLLGDVDVCNQTFAGLQIANQQLENKSNVLEKIKASPLGNLIDKYGKPNIEIQSYELSKRNTKTPATYDMSITYKKRGFGIVASRNIGSVRLKDGPGAIAATEPCGRSPSSTTAPEGDGTVYIERKVSINCLRQSTCQGRLTMEPTCGFSYGCDDNPAEANNGHSICTAMGGSYHEVGFWNFSCDGVPNKDSGIKANI